MRCDEFYDKWRRCGNFCEKHPDTAREIDAIINFLDVEPDLSGLSAKALRPLIREPNPEVRDRAIESVGKSLESGKNPVTGKFSNKPPTERDVKQVIEDVKKVVHVSHNSGDIEWYTPEEYTTAARLTMGGIDLDPASTAEANKIVKAGKFFTVVDNGLKHQWMGSVWMNPPYASDVIGSFASKLCEEFKKGHVIQACVLVNNATETRWFQEMAALAGAITFPKRRIRFWHPQKNSITPLQGQAVLYIGNNIDDFHKNFSAFGTTCDVL